MLKYNGLELANYIQKCLEEVWVQEKIKKQYCIA